MTRTVLITGATGKIGRVLVRHFLSAGETVIAVGRSQSTLDALSKELSAVGGILHGLCADLLDADAGQEILDGLARLGVKPDCIVNNARNRDFLRTGTGGRVARADFLRELALDVVAPYELVMAIAHMEGTALKAVVNIGSQYGSVAPNLALYGDLAGQSPLHYGVAKAGLAHLTKELAVRLAKLGVRVNCVAFGGVEGRVDEAFRQRYAALCPMGRMLSEHELAGPVDFLLSEAGSAMTGHTLMADGGWSVW